MGDAAYQYEPVTKIRAAAARAFSAPISAEMGWPLAMHLPQLERAGCTPTTDHEQSRATRIHQRIVLERRGKDGGQIVAGECRRGFEAFEPAHRIQVRLRLPGRALPTRRLRPRTSGPDP